MDTSSLPLISQLRSRVESVLLVIDAPITVAALARALGVDKPAVAQVIDEISEEFDDRGSGIELRETGEGWRLYTRRDNAEAVESFLLDGAQTRLSRAALETLAVVAYRQPVTRSQVAAVRGVNVDGVMRTLQLRGLVADVEAEPGTGAHRYVTTESFLELLGIDSLERLPDLAPLLPDVESIEEEY